MGRALGILLAVVALWTALEVYTQGVGAAFGGAFAGLAEGAPGSPAPDPTPRSAVRRAGDSVERALRESERRTQAQLDE
jgi:hypothetical protein